MRQFLQVISGWGLLLLFSALTGFLTSFFFYPSHLLPALPSAVYRFSGGFFYTLLVSYFHLFPYTKVMDWLLVPGAVITGLLALFLSRFFWIQKGRFSGINLFLLLLAYLLQLTGIFSPILLGILTASREAIEKAYVSYPFSYFGVGGLEMLASLLLIQRVVRGRQVEAGKPLRLVYAAAGALVFLLQFLILQFLFYRQVLGGLLLYPLNPFTLMAPVFLLMAVSVFAALFFWIELRAFRSLFSLLFSIGIISAVLIYLPPAVQKPLPLPKAIEIPEIKLYTPQDGEVFAKNRAVARLFTGGEGEVLDISMDRELASQMVYAKLPDEIALYVPAEISTQVEQLRKYVMNPPRVREALLKWAEIRAFSARQPFYSLALQLALYDPFLTDDEFRKFRFLAPAVEDFSPALHFQVLLLFSSRNKTEETTAEWENMKQNIQRVNSALGHIYSQEEWEQKVEALQKAFGTDERSIGGIQGRLLFPPEALNPDELLSANAFVGVSYLFPREIADPPASFLVRYFPLKPDGTFNIQGIGFGRYALAILLYEKGFRKDFPIHLSNPPEPFSLTPEKYVLQMDTLEFKPTAPGTDWFSTRK